MHRPRRTLPVLGLTTALALGLVGLHAGTSTAVDAAGPAGAGPAAASTDHARAVPMSQAVRLRPAGRKAKWPVKRRTAVTAADTEVDPAAVPAQRMAAARIVQDLVRGTISAKVRLRAAPGPTTDSRVIVALGRATDGGAICQSLGETTIWWYAYGVDGQSAPGLLRDGARMELLHFPAEAARQDQFDCAFAETWRIEPEGQTPYRVLFDGRGATHLKPTYDKPTLKVKAPRRVDVRLHRWKRIKVRVTNSSSRVTAPGVTVKVAGARVRSTTAKLGKLRPGKTRTAKVRIRADRGHRAKAKVVVRTQDVRKTRTLRLR